MKPVNYHYSASPLSLYTSMFVAETSVRGRLENAEDKGPELSVALSQFYMAR